VRQKNGISHAGGLMENPWLGLAMKMGCYNPESKQHCFAGMTRSELISAIASKNPRLTIPDVELVVKAILDEMSQSLARGDRIEIRGFGSFEINQRPARIGRNPKTGEKVEVPEKRGAHFKAGKELRERVDKPSRR
jgi:integration host factor subunit beta